MFIERVLFPLSVTTYSLISTLSLAPAQLPLVADYIATGVPKHKYLINHMTLLYFTKTGKINITERNRIIR
jgi:hypothetical protein